MLTFMFNLLLLLLLAVVSINHAAPYKFDFPTFIDGVDDKNFIRNTSYIVSSAIQVTPDLSLASISNKSGRIVHIRPFRLWNKKKKLMTSFNTTFVINITPGQSSPAGEGLAFILTGDPSLPGNSEGQWLGLVNATTNGSKLASVVGIEFDTRKSFLEDGDDNHVGLDVNSVYSVRQEPLIKHGVNLTAGGKTGTNVSVHVRYDAVNVSVYVYMTDTFDDEPVLSEPVFSERIDLSEILPETVYVGFAASTSDYTELNCVRSWAFYAEEINSTNYNLWVIISIPILAVLLLSSGAYFMYRDRQNRVDADEDSYPRIEDQITGSSTAPRKFKLKELRRATGNFDERYKLGSGGFGTVYKGLLLNKEVAVKRISKDSRQGKQEFVAEVTTIGSLHHKNLVKLIGWCYEKNELLLVYEYLSMGSLDKYIFAESQSRPGLGEDLSLSWEKRARVIFGVAHALDYLHNGCDRKVLHRDIKASNIMLDHDFLPKLGDFGLARTIHQSDLTHHSTNAIAGTPGYMAPESMLVGRATEQTDVYAFGVLVLEVTCGRKPGNQVGDDDYSSSIVYWLWKKRREGKILEAVDWKLKGEFEKEEMECLMVLGLACCHPNPHKRPSMRVVLQVLTGEADPPELPLERPAFVWPAMPPSFSKECSNSVTGGEMTPFTQLSGR